MSWKPNIMSWKPKTFNNINDFISRAAEAISCGPECQKQREIQSLEEKYLVAQRNLINAPAQLDEARRNYMINTQGEAAYNDYIDNELTTKAKQTTDLFLQIFNAESNQIVNKLNAYKIILTNFKNILELYKKYEKENVLLKNELKQNISEIQTNDRKTFYEDQSLDNLKFYYYILVFVYIVIIIVFLLSLFLYPSSYSIYKKIGVFILIFIYPFISIYIATFFVWGFYKILSLLPKNVYKDI